MINTIILGHALNVLPKLPAESVSCVTTSPPYWGLRDYGIEPVIWDGDKEFYSESLKKYIPMNCKHDFSIETKAGDIRFRGKNSIVGSERNPKVWEGDGKGQFCQKCGAFRGSLGLEPTFELYIKHLCDIFDEVKRVLRKDGTCWVNLGDSYTSNGGASRHFGYQDPKYKNGRCGNYIEPSAFKQSALPKSLCLIPQRFAIEMVNRGWILRNTLIWHKPNCMPSSAKDRFTVDFEYVYFFVKSKKYWFEQAFEDAIDNEETFYKKRGSKIHKTVRLGNPFSHHQPEKATYNPNGRNKRAVWTIPTQPFPEAHFAVYPEGLIEIPIKAGCPEFICKKCGKARVKILEPTEEYKKLLGKSWHPHKHDAERGMSETPDKKASCTAEYKFKGYSDCGCNAGFESGIVLDPFMGAGTTALVALKQRKRFIGIEIKQEYIDMSYKRIAKVQQRIF